jgi:ATP-binding cassette subfamily B protein
VESVTGNPQEAGPLRGEFRSTHFVFRYPTGSRAEHDASRVVNRLEAFYDALVAALQLTAEWPEPIPVFLSDDLELATGFGSLGTHDRDAVVEAGGVRAAYRPERPANSLERAITELLLRRALGLDPHRAMALIDGIVGHVVRQIDASVAASHAPAPVGPEGSPPPLRELLRMSAPGGASAYRQAVTSLVSYLLAAEGPERFKAFVQAFDPSEPDRAAEQALGRPLVVLEQGWSQAIHGQAPVTVPGITMFLRRAVVYLRPYWRAQLAILGCTLLTAGFAVIQPLALQWMIDRAIVPRDYRFLTLLIGALGVLFVVQGFATLGMEYLNATVAAAVLNDLRLRLFRQLQHLSMGFHVQAQVGDLMSRLSSDLYVVQGAMTGAIVQLVYLAITIVASAVLLVALEWRLALLALGAAPLVLVGTWLFGKRAAEAGYQLQDDTAQVATALQENLNAQLVVKAFGLEERATARFAERAATLARSMIRATFLGALLGLSGSLTVTFIQLLILAVGGYMVMQASLSLGALVAFIGLLGNVLSPMQGLTGIIENLQRATGGLRRVEELVAEESQVVDAVDASRLPRPKGEIRFEHVIFSYTGERVNLRDVDFRIAAGSSVTFVGPSGCGKSTVLGLILRFYDPAAGAVRIDDQDLRRMTQASVRQHMALVPQDTFLFNVSVRENIRLARPDATDEDIEAAARAAQLHEIVVALPHGYDTEVGERGARLSGGQRQRVAIARAILRDAAIILLDEATSALDPQTEAAINGTLARLGKGRTVIAVTHRLASAASADRIFVLDQGRLVQQGTHDELVQQEGVYAQLWQQQGAALEGGPRLVADVARLQAVPLFASLDGILLAALGRELATERYADREVIVTEGQLGDRLYIIVEGQVEVVTLGPAGVERRLAILRTGDYFGEMALLTEAPRSATVRARGPAVLLTLDRTQLRNLLDRLPDLRTALDRVVETRRQANRAVSASTVQS